jgi:hypothetical protein
MERVIRRPDFYKDQDAIVSLFKSLCPFTVIPDIYQAVGDGRVFFNLIRTLAGLTVKFPALETIQNMLIAIDIVLSVTLSDNADLSSVVQELSCDYGLLPVDILMIYSRARNIILDGAEFQREAFMSAVNALMTERGTRIVNADALRKAAVIERRKRRYDAFPSGEF